ncbi:hypothetical protein XENOCAPTIV_017248 [Xenoophorus captivus]|uniref:Uncharacterized protein n=1 Tax=Xenoophorus captivus TaxID=1517983 RepID=A0ABV0QIR1_9TELE
MRNGDRGSQLPSETDRFQDESLQHFSSLDGMTKTLGTVLHYRNCTMGHNMITMDIVRRILEDQSADADASLDWVHE